MYTGLSISITANTDGTCAWCPTPTPAQYARTDRRDLDCLLTIPGLRALKVDGACTYHAQYWWPWHFANRPYAVSSHERGTRVTGYDREGRPVTGNVMDVWADGLMCRVLVHGGAPHDCASGDLTLL